MKTEFHSHSVEIYNSFHNWVCSSYLLLCSTRVFRL